ncbi:hypothetical protein GCM10008968_39610 [Bacillus horti]
MEQNGTQLETNLEVEQSGSNILFKLHLENKGTEDVELEFSSSQQYEVTIKDEDGEEVYRHSIDKMFAQALTTVEVKAGETYTWEDELDLNSQSVVLDGTVTVEAEIVATNTAESLGLSQSDLTATAELEWEATEDSTGGSEDPNTESGDNEVYENDTFRNIEVSGENGVYTITGEARVFEANLNYSVTEGHFYYIEDAHETTSNGAPNWGTFTINIDISEEELPVNGTVTLELYETSAKDGSRMDELFIPLESFN